jgi:ABC-2 type transport system ATP-binding protein
VPAIVSPEAARLTVPMSDPDRVADLLVAFRESGLHLEELSVQQPTLDEVFLTLTGRGVPDDDAAAHATADDLEGVRA